MLPKLTLMSALEALKNNLHFARTLVVEGRNRYFGVTRTALAIEQIYRKYRNRAKVLSEVQAEALLRDTHRESADLICDLCKENGAIWVKFAQFLSCRPDILPLEYIISLQRLQNDANPAPFEAIHPMIVDEWGMDWDKAFRAFNAIPAATASVAQVHRATTSDGQEVAVKFQLPDARELFEQDSRVFKTFAGLLAPLVKEIDIKQVTDQLIDMTIEELDFTREAKNLAVFSSKIHLPGIKIPRLIESLSTGRIMVTEWIDGVKLTDYLHQHPDKAQSILTRLLNSYIQQITQLGIYHADPHPGNFLITPNEEIAVLDYGAIVMLDGEQRSRYANLLLGLMGMHPERLGELFRQAGFVCERQETLEEISDRFIADDRRETSVSDRLADVLDKLRRDRVQMPDSFIAMARVIISIGGFLKRFDVPFTPTAIPLSR